VISRSGANTISELTAVGKAAILVPSPNVAEDHQTKNAEALSTRDAALLFKETGSSAELIAAFKSILDAPEQKLKLEENIQGMALPKASITIVDEIEKLIGHAR